MLALPNQEGGEKPRQTHRSQCWFRSYQSYLSAHPQHTLVLFSLHIPYEFAKMSIFTLTWWCWLVLTPYSKFTEIFTLRGRRTGEIEQMSTGSPFAAMARNHRHAPAVTACQNTRQDHKISREKWYGKTNYTRNFLWNWRQTKMSLAQVI